MEHQFTYAAALSASERINWRVEDLIGDDTRLDFAKPFLPESLARVRGLSFLSADEQLALNHIRGHAYLGIFGLVEEFILPFVVDHARPNLQGDDYRARALLQFAAEEAKHIHLFKRFRETFERDFGVRCDVIGPPEAVAEKVLSHHPLAVALVILHIEWMTQRHYTESVKDDQDLDPHFKSLLKHHWMEEAQHAKLDTLVIEALCEEYAPEDAEAAAAEYAEIGAFLDEGLEQQTVFDMEALERATGRRFADVERARFMDIQHQANRWTFLGSGMTHPSFRATLAKAAPSAHAQVEEMAPAFC